MCRLYRGRESTDGRLVFRSASPLTLAGKTRLPGLVAGLTFALFAQPVLGPFGAFCELTLSARFEGPLRETPPGRSLPVALAMVYDSLAVQGDAMKRFAFLVALFISISLLAL